MSVPYRITETSTVRNYLREVAKQLLDMAERTPDEQLFPNLPQSTWVARADGQVKDEHGQLKPIWYSHAHVLSTDIALVKQFQEDFKEWQKQKSGK